MANPIDTPQVIFGLDKGGTFQDFEERRRRGGSHLSDWYTGAASKGHIWLSTIENNDVISFSHKFNSDSPEDQSLFVIEVLDPTNTFEHRLFKTFYSGAESFEKIMEDHALAIISRSKPSDVPIIKNKTVNKLGALPGSVPMYVTFGMGNNLEGWSPATKCSLVTFDYGLTDEGVKKLILRFVPSAGAVRLNSASMVEKYLKSTSNVKIKYSELVLREDEQNKIPYRPTSDVYIRNPINLFFDIFKNVIKSTTKSNVIFLLDELKKPLVSRWNTLVIAAARQHIQSLEKIKTVGLVDSGLASELEQQILKNIMIRTDLEGAAALGLGEQEKGFRVTAPKDALKKAKAHVAAAARAERDLASNVVPIKLKNGTPLPTMNKIMGARETAGWAYRSGMSPEDFFGRSILAKENAFKVRDLLGTGGNHLVDAVERYAWGDLMYDEKKRIKENIENMPIEAMRGPDDFRSFQTDAIHFYKFFYKHKGMKMIAEDPDVHIDKDTADDFYKQLQIAKDSDAWNEGPLRYLGDVYGKSAEENAHGYYKSLKQEWPEYITLKNKDVYVIFKTAFENFFGTLGLTTGPVRPQKIQSAGGGIPFVDNKVNGIDSGASSRKIQEDQMKKQLYVSISIDTAEELKEKLIGIIDGLNVGPSIHLTMNSFSELSLVDKLTRAVNDDTVLPTGTAPDGSLRTKEVLFVTSVRVLASLVSNTDLDDETLELLASNNLYQSIKNGYRLFNKGEPSIHSNKMVPFSQLFDNPDMEELKLDTDNVLTLFSEDKDLKFDDNEKLNKYLLDNNIPVFNYGFKNSNILNFNFSLKLWFAHMLSILPQVALLGAKLPSVKDATIDESLLKFWKGPNAAQDISKHAGKYYDDYIKDVTDAKQGGSGSRGWKKAHEEIYRISEEYGADISDWDEVEGGTLREYFINAVTKAFKSMMANESCSDYLPFNTENQDTAVRTLLDIRRAMSSRVFTAKITTLPFFSFISAGKVIGKTALLYFMEPEIIASVGSKDKRTRSTWLSGSYLIVGYDVTMSNSRLTTSFNLLKQ